MPYKILLVDDDMDDRDIFVDSMAMVSDNMEVITMENGVVLLEALNSGSMTLPDIIFLDINVPEMDGWTCLSQLKQNADYAAIPVIMYSTSNQQDEAKRAKKAGALSFLSKPFDFKDLKEALKEVADHLENNTIATLTTNSKRFF